MSREIEAFLVVLEVSAFGVVAEAAEDVENLLLLFGCQFVVAAVVSPEVRLAAEMVDDLESQVVVVFSLHVGKEAAEAPSRADDAQLAEHRALVALECVGIDAGAVVGPCGSGLACGVAHALLAMRTLFVEAYGIHLRHVFGPDVYLCFHDCDVSCL